MTPTLPDREGPAGSTQTPIVQVPEIVRELYRTAARLGELFQGRKFTLDGHLVGSIGEVVAAAWYGLELFDCSTEAHDARAADGRLVQVKATQREKVALYACPEHLIVLQLLPDGTAKKVFNGPGVVAWAKVGPRQKTSACHIALSTLRRLMADVPAVARLPRAIAAGDPPPTDGTLSERGRSAPSEKRESALRTAHAV